jgi:hypothetical protein
MRTLSGGCATGPTSPGQHLRPARNGSPSPVSGRDAMMVVGAGCSNRPCGLPALSATVTNCGFRRALDYTARAFRAEQHDIRASMLDDDDVPRRVGNPTTFVRLRTDSTGLHEASLPWIVACQKIIGHDSLEQFT